MFVNPKHLYPNILPHHIPALEKMSLTPLALDLCRHKDAQGRLKIVSANVASIDLSLDNGMPVMKLSGPDKDGEYKVESYTTDLRQRGAHGTRRILVSKRPAYLFKQLAPKLSEVLLSADIAHNSQLQSAMNFYQRRVQHDTDYSNDVEISVNGAAFNELMVAVKDNHPFFTLTEWAQAHLAKVAESAASMVEESQKYISKLREFALKEKFVIGWAPRGIFVGIAKLRLNEAYNPTVQEWRRPVKFYNTWAEFDREDQALQRECLTALGFLRAHRDGSEGGESRDDHKLFPSGDVAFLQMNAVAFFTAQVSRRNPQWVIMDRLLGE